MAVSKYVSSGLLLFLDQMVFAGVKSADAYILTKLQYYDNWIMKEINKRLLLRPVLHSSR